MTPTGMDGGRTDACLLQSSRLFHNDLARLFHLVHGGDQRQHQLDIVTGGCAKDGAYLGTEHLRLIETYPDGAPSEERIGFHRSLERRGELVSPQIEGANDHGVIGEGEGDSAEVLGLFVFRREAGSPGQQKLGPQESHAMCAKAYGGLDLLRKVHVAHQGDRPARRRDRRLAHHRFELQLELVAPADLNLGLFQLITGGIENDGAALPVEQQHRSARDRGSAPRLHP